MAKMNNVKAAHIVLFVMSLVLLILFWFAQFK